MTTSCDDSCCCDPNCSASAISYWNNYYLCANDGFAIPFCSAYYSQPLHVHDLSQGLRLIYTVRLGLFFRWSKDCFASRRLTSSIPARAIRLRPRISSCLRVRVRWVGSINLSWIWGRCLPIVPCLWLMGWAGVQLLLSEIWTASKMVIAWSTSPQRQQ